MTKNFIYYLAAIGNPNFDKKIEFLNQNLNCIHQYYSSYDIFINCYDELPIESFVNKEKFPFLNNIIIVRKQGILSQLWINNPKHSLLQEYDYILFILDDILLKSFHIPRLIKMKINRNLQFISPIVENSTWPFMRNKTYSNLFQKTKRLEIYCFLLTYNDFISFLDLNTLENYNIWGVDYMMTHKNISCGLSTKDIVIHSLPSGSNHDLALEQMNEYFNRNGFTNRNEFLKIYPDPI